MAIDILINPVNSNPSDPHSYQSGDIVDVRNGGFFSGQLHSYVITVSDIPGSSWKTLQHVLARESFWFDDSQPTIDRKIRINKRRKYGFSTDAFKTIFAKSNHVRMTKSELKAAMIDKDVGSVDVNETLASGVKKTASTIAL